MLKKIFAVMTMALTVFALSACVKKEIVVPQQAALIPRLDKKSEPVEIDWEQAYNGVDQLLADKDEYPMGKYVSYLLYDDVDTGLETLEMQWCVDDSCTGKDAQMYGEIIVKAFNDELAIQDSNIRKSGEGDYGGFFDTCAAVVVIYHEDAEDNFQEAEVFQHIQPGSNAGIMQYIKASEREGMEDVDPAELFGTEQ